jgi:hypothetical protein
MAEGARLEVRLTSLLYETILVLWSRLDYSEFRDFDRGEVAEILGLGSGRVGTQRIAPRITQFVKLGILERNPDPLHSFQLRRLCPNIVVAGPHEDISKAPRYNLDEEIEKIEFAISKRSDTNSVVKAPTGTPIPQELLELRQKINEYEAWFLQYIKDWDRIDMLATNLQVEMDTHSPSAAVQHGIETAIKVFEQANDKLSSEYGKRFRKLQRALEILSPEDDDGSID